MIREIERPEIDFKFWIWRDYKFYYNEENGEYFLKTGFKTKIYFNLEGNVHRIGKPAIEYCDGEKQWRENGKCHRLNGAAHIYYYNKYYFINNNNYIEKEFAEKTKHLVCGNCGGFCKQECFI